MIARSLIAQVVIITLLIIGVVFGWRYALGARQQAFALRVSLEEHPQNVLQAATLKTDLAKRQFDIDRITQLLLTRQTIGQAISTIESEGARRQIQVQVPSVQEKQLYDEQGQPIEQTGPLFQIAVSVVAQGDPEQLLSFLHAIEHLPYLLYIESWEISLSRTALPPSGIGQAPSDRGAPPPAPPGLLQASVVLFIVDQAL